MMQTADVQSGMGVMGINKAPSQATAPASRNMPRGGFAISVKRVNAPDRIRRMAIPAAQADQPRYFAPGAA
jgi:hypothetical protein